MFSIQGPGLRPVRHKDTLQKRRMPLVRAISFDDQSGILDSHEYPGREPRHDALLAGENRPLQNHGGEHVAGVESSRAGEGNGGFESRHSRQVFEQHCI
jgi:hypothetical protein